MSRSKRFKALAKEVPKEKLSLEQALEFVQEKSTEKFDPSLELHVKLGIDPKQSDQNVRGSVTLPAGTGKTVKVAAIVSEDKQSDAKDAGADVVAGEDLIDQIKKTGKMDFDVLVASPDMMPKLGQIAKILGPKGLMPNPKTETVGPDVGALVKAIKSGKANFKNDEFGIIHMPVGKKSFDRDKLKQNLDAAIEAIRASKPDNLKGAFIETVTLTTSMGPGLRLNIK